MPPTHQTPDTRMRTHLVWRTHVFAVVTSMPSAQAHNNTAGPALCSCLERGPRAALCYNKDSWLPVGLTAYSLLTAD